MYEACLLVGTVLPIQRIQPSLKCGGQVCGVMLFCVERLVSKLRIYWWSSHVETLCLQWPNGPQYITKLRHIIWDGLIYLYILELPPFKLCYLLTSLY